MLATLESLASKRGVCIAIIAALIALFTGMRAVYLSADSPQDLTISAAIFTDEGFKTFDSRNDILVGAQKWTPEDEYEAWNTRSPLTAMAFEWVFSHFGVSFASARVISVFYSFLAMIILAIFMARRYGRVPALVATVLFGTNFFILMHGRLALYESHLLFYLALSLLGFSEAMTGSGGGAKRMAVRALFLLAGIASILSAFYIKRSIFIIAVALLPAAVLYLAAKRENPPEKLNRKLLMLMAMFLAVYGILAHMNTVKIILLFVLNATQVQGQILSDFIPVVLFDPIHLVIGRGLYAEFIFLHPLTFAASMLCSIRIFHSFIFEGKRNGTDLALASWLFFGFFLLSILDYHPSRYYLLLAVPLIVLATRIISEWEGLSLASFIQTKKPFPFNVLFWGLCVTMLVYTGVVFIVTALPFDVRYQIFRIVYPAGLRGDYAAMVPIAAAVMATEAILVAAVLVFRRRLVSLTSRAAFPSVLLIAILALQLFNYGRWFFFHENNLSDLSRRLGRELPANAVITGSWSAGLVMENRLRALIFQSFVPYNHELMKKLLENREIDVVSGRGAVRKEKDMPLYIAVCRDVIFERTITTLYEDYLKPDRLRYRVRLGYYTLEIYEMDRSVKFEKDFFETAKKFFRI